MTIARNRDGNNSKAERRGETSSLKKKKKTSTDKKDRRKLGIRGEKKTKLFAYSTIGTSATKIMKTVV